MSDTNWVGKICPYCEKRLQEPDNVLVCERCGTPYHAACWYEHKGCKYHDGFGKPYDRSTPPPKEELRCPDCGARINAGAQFCSQCGHHCRKRLFPGGRSADRGQLLLLLSSGTGIHWRPGGGIPGQVRQAPQPKQQYRLELVCLSVWTLLVFVPQAVPMGGSILAGAHCCQTGPARRYELAGYCRRVGSRRTAGRFSLYEED